MSINFENLILYEDNHLLVVHKPAKLLSQKDNTKDIDVVSLTKDYLISKYQKRGDAYVGLVHRLDRMTEGVMVLTKTSKAASRLSNDIVNNNWHKTYLCLVEGIIEKDSRLLDYLDHDSNTKKMKIVKVGTGQKAELEYSVVAHFKDKTLLKVNLITGRHHQIRVQMANFKHPIVGDSLYGVNKFKHDLMLACIEIRFKHPTLDKVIDIKSLPKSKKWKKYLKNIEVE